MVTIQARGNKMRSVGVAEDHVSEMLCIMRRHLVFLLSRLALRIKLRIRHTGLACVSVEALFRGLGGQAELDRAWKDLQEASHQKRKILRIEQVQELFTAKFGSMDRSGWFMDFSVFFTSSQNLHRDESSYSVMNESVRFLANTNVETSLIQSAIRTVFDCLVAVSLPETWNARLSMTVLHAATFQCKQTCTE